jgi:hypothetical protein
VAALEGRLSTYLAQTAVSLEEEYAETIAQVHFEEQQIIDPLRAAEISKEKEAERQKLSKQYPGVLKATYDGHIVRD